MNNLRLPEIPFGGPNPSVADRIDRAGAQFADAANKVGEVLGDIDKAEIQVQTQEATLQAAKGVTDTLHLIKSTPYMKPEQVRGIFGGKPPPDVKLTEKVQLPGGVEEERDREVIPTHEFVPQLFEDRARLATENAAGAISDPGWQARWKAATAADVEKARAEALDWQRAQRSTDIHVRSVAQFNQAVAARAWNRAALVLENPEIDVKTRETLVAELPNLRTKAEVEDRLRSGDPEELERLAQDLAGNNFEHAKLPADQQRQYAAQVRERKREIRNEQEHVEKVENERLLEGEFDKIQMAVNESKRTGAPVSRFYSVSDIPLGVKGGQYITIKSFLDGMSQKERKTDNNVWLRLEEMDRQGKLATLTPAEMKQYWPGLSDEHQRTWMDRWSKARAGGPGKSMFSEVENGVINDVLTFYKFDPKNKPDEFNIVKSLAQQNLIEWRKNHPQEPLLFNTALVELGTTLFNAKSDPVFSDGTAREWFRDNLKDPTTVAALSIGIKARKGGAPVTMLDIQQAAKEMQESRPIVEKAWADLNPNDETPLTEGEEAVIHSILTNPVDLEKVDAQLRASKHPVNPVTRIYRIVANRQPEQNQARATKIAERRLEEKRQEEVRAAGSADKSRRDEILAADSAAAKRMTEGEKAAFRAKPTWEQKAILATDEEFAFQEDFLTDQIRARIYAEDYAAQGFVPGTRAKLGQRRADDPVRVEMDRRAAAEAAAGREERKRAFEARQVEARDAYRRYWESQMVNDDGSTKVFAPPGFLEFGAWVRQNRGPSHFGPPALAGAR
jgi:hypothetical protein